MMDELKDYIVDAARKAHRDLGNNPGGRSLLSDGNLGAMVLDQYEKNQILEEENIRDSLTGAFNRRYFVRIAEVLLKSQTPFALVMVDIDNFKPFNDLHGHLVGDAALIHLVAVVDNIIKVARVEGKEDILARWGGEEFVVLLRGVKDLNRAREIAERIRDKIKISKFGTEDGKKLRMTISGGVTVSRPGDSLNLIVGRADKALLEAKRGGRDKIVTQ